MSPRHGHSALLVLLVVMGTAPRAQARDEAPLTLEEVLDSVRQQHPGMEAARQGVATAEAELLSAQGGFDTLLKAKGVYVPFSYYPHERLDAVVEQPTPLGGTRLFAGYRLGQGKFPTYYGEYETLSGGELRAGVEIPLWRNRSIDKRRADISKARLRLDIAGFTLVGEQLELQREAAYHYWDWVAAGRQLAIAEAQYALAVTRHEQLARRVAQGDIPQIEHTENERALLEREADRVAARRKLEQTALKLSLSLRDGEGRPVRASDSRLPEGLPLPDDTFQAELDAWLEKALRQRPELRELALQRDVVQLDAELARNQTAPAVDLGISVLRDLGRGPESLRPTELQASLVLDIPLQARGARGQVQAAEAKRAAVDAKARLTRDKVVTEVRDTLSALKAAHERVGLARSAADVARRLAQAELARFEHGATSLLFVNLREQTAADAELKEIKALVDYHRAVVDLLAAAAALEPGPSRPEQG
ncbi:outer membrane protein TolC [Archangium gephyra]|uniref:Outer membrane component of multidrug efflux pump n=1 Tax=Archangium gephyra TaxID=48 RepID=A0AAC8QA44_9BACT|nr:TolC family protein [Archangium gephyra]AKJ03351.1 Outer membrane component of multidrug efflux pump [Archangium gephyra]REG24139.1 outer membrane protein TolC [Archangium gephyra]